MEFTGKIVSKEKLPAGQSEKVVLHLTEEGEYPNSLLVEFYGDKKIPLTDDVDVGDTVTVAYNTRVSEYNGKKYQNISGWKFNGIDKSTAVEEELDDIPF